MRKTALVFALALVVAPTAAFAKKPAAAPADPNANGKKFVQAAFMQPYLAFQSAMTPKAAPTQAKAVKATKSKKMVKAKKMKKGKMAKAKRA